MKRANETVAPAKGLILRRLALASVFAVASLPIRGAKAWRNMVTKPMPPGTPTFPNNNF